jgi:uncharacterized protein YjbI with pentapeptide repeats
MANEEHLQILKRGVLAWNRWRHENRDITPILSEAILSRAILDRAILSQAILSQAGLDQVAVVRRPAGGRTTSTLLRLSLALAASR